MTLLTADEEVAMLQNYVARGDVDLDAVTNLLRKVIESGSWAKFSTATGFTVEHESFHTFVTDKRPDGLGTTRDALVAWVGASDEDLAKELDQKWKSDVPAANGHGRPNKGSATTLTDSGKTADGITARLKRDDPELAEKVIHGEITANAAAHQKGWRKPRVILTSPESLAKQIGKHWTPEQIAQTINALTELLHEDPHKLAQPVKGLRAGQPNEQATT